MYYFVAWANNSAVRSVAANLFLAGKKHLYNSCTLIIRVYLDPPLQPLVVIMPSVVNLIVNNYNLTMKCLPNKKNLNYKWIKKDGVLTSRAQGVNTSQMTIVNLTPKDSGEYQCVMSNSTGTIISNFTTLHVQGKTENYIRKLSRYLVITKFQLQGLHQKFQSSQKI